MRKLLIVVLILAILGVAAFFGYRELQRRRAAQVPTYETVTIGRGDISATVSATGAVLPEREVTLALGSAGTIATVNVEAGQVVGEGDVLATMDTSDLELALRQAQIGVTQASAQLQQLQEAANQADVSAAQAALASAQGGLESSRAAYQQTLRGPDSDSLAAAQAQVEQAKVQLVQAQQAYDRVKDRPDVAMMPQSVQLQNATIAVETAEAQYRAAQKSVTSAQVSAARAQVTGAEAQVAQAQASLDRLLRGPSPAQVTVAQAGVDQATVALEQAERRLANAKLVAPWAGVVAAVSIVEGGAATPGQPAIRLVDTAVFHLDVQVDEVDIAGIQAGQTVQIEIDALPDARCTGKVKRISPAATTSQTGGVSYAVRLDIDPTDAPLLAGMSATTTIIANTRQDVLLVPNRVVQLERETGRTYVMRDEAGALQRVEVQLGLRDDQFSEVREGLAEGDVLAVVNRTSQEQLRNLFGGGF